MSAVFAPRDMSAECRRATALDCTHHLHLTQANMPCVCRTPGTTVIAEDIRNLQ
jgi:hypothetical protein